MSGIMSMFSNMFAAPSAPAATAPAAQTAPATAPTTPGNIPQGAPATGVAAPGTAPNGVLPGNENANPKPATPLDQFSELWKTPESNPNAQSSGVFGDIDPKRFMEAAGKIDFTKVVNTEQLTAITQGGEGAMQAFANAMNAVAQQTYAQSAYASTKIVEQAVAKMRENVLAELPSHIKKQTVSDNLRAENPVFSNPAVQPVISALEAQLTVKYPNASATEITQMAKNYVEALGTSFSPKPAEVKPKNNETDWSSFLS